MNRRWSIIGALALFGLSSSLATASSAPGFAEVKKIVQERAGATVSWAPGTKGKNLPADSLEALFQTELTATRAVQIALLNNLSLQAMGRNVPRHDVAGQIAGAIGVADTIKPTAKGGLLTTTLINMLVTPAVFWLFGRPAAERVLQECRQAVGGSARAEEPGAPVAARGAEARSAG